jgi:hypothetical protein
MATALPNSKNKKKKKKSKFPKVIRRTLPSKTL